MLEIARWSLEIFLRSKCSTIFRLEIARIENSKFKIVLEIARIEKFNARNARDRCFSRSVSTLFHRCYIWIFVIFHELIFYALEPHFSSKKFYHITHISILCSYDRSFDVYYMRLFYQTTFHKSYTWMPFQFSFMMIFKVFPQLGGWILFLITKRYAKRQQ